MKPIPYFDSIIGEENLKAVNEWRQAVSQLMDELMTYGRDACGFCYERGKKANRRADIVLLGFARHILVYLDCVKTLLEHGCVEGCTPLLRSILEAKLGIAHLVKERSEERALAHKLMLVRNEINRLQMGDKSHPEGQKVQTELVGDIYTPDLLDKMPTDLAARAAKLQQQIDSDSEFTPIVAELNRIKGSRQGKDPEWYRLFGTASNIREWAKSLNCSSFYFFLYKPLSGEAHVGNVVKTLYVRDNEFRPLRYPDDFHGVVQLAFQLFGLSFDRLTQFYGADLNQTFQAYMVQTMYQRMADLTQRMRKAFKRLSC